jgi:hypothetical protein
VNPGNTGIDKSFVRRYNVWDDRAGLDVCAYTSCTGSRTEVYCSFDRLTFRQREESVPAVVVSGWRRARVATEIVVVNTGGVAGPAAACAVVSASRGDLCLGDAEQGQFE